MAETQINPFPPTIIDHAREDTARYVVPLGAFLRPRLYIVDGEEFVWPLGTEGITVSGAATVAEHKYIGGNALVVDVTHLDASRIEMSGMFPGLTSTANVRALRRLCRLPNPSDYKRLEVPGVFSQAQRIVAENWDFTRVEDDPHAWTYRVSLIVVGTNQIPTKNVGGTTTLIGQTPSNLKTMRGEPAHVVTVKQGAQTLKAVAFQAYGDASKWKIIYMANRDVIQQALGDVPLVAAAVARLPVGIKLKYINSGNQ